MSNPQTPTIAALRAELERLAREWRDVAHGQRLQAQRFESDPGRYGLHMAGCLVNENHAAALRAALDHLSALPEAGGTAEIPSLDVRQPNLLAYLDTLTITGDNIGEIRRGLLMPFACAWNGWVRDETARREQPLPPAPAVSQPPQVGEK